MINSFEPEPTKADLAAEEQYKALVQQLRHRLIELESQLDIAIKKHDSLTLLTAETQHHILRVFLRVLESNHRDPDFLHRKGIQPEVNPIALTLLNPT
jgi:hypothetical protein